MQVTDDAGGDDDDDEIVTIDCPYCRKPIWEEAVACEHCGNYLSKESKPWSRPWWLVLGCVAGLFVVYLWIRHSH